MALISFKMRASLQGHLAALKMFVTQKRGLCQDAGKQGSKGASRSVFGYLSSASGKEECVKPWGLAPPRDPYPLWVVGTRNGREKSHQKRASGLGARPWSSYTENVGISVPQFPLCEVGDLTPPCPPPHISQT